MKQVRAQFFPRPVIEEEACAARAHVSFGHKKRAGAFLQGVPPSIRKGAGAGEAQAGVN